MLTQMNLYFFGDSLAEDRGSILHMHRDKLNASINFSAKIMLTTSKDVLETLGASKQPDDILVALEMLVGTKINLRKN
ncbi:putative transcriptional regulator [secondary endosymbiont of Heteropsylla cubana]|uniref:Putative transcriptional regulator n=1 Tax=secondary endosymbiont of Heteropsylla cubana TaxID=134287 RepID=J3Z5Y3_9ENTR|nr:YqgE/AlgH family protein [secondary endosymbiont of Heteropsylla cubana]AFP85779.1 putative transcriptional regulator [secondary endosymbiont of Heteropsylla cubana]